MEARKWPDGVVGSDAQVGRLGGRHDAGLDASSNPGIGSDSFIIFTPIEQDRLEFRADVHARAVGFRSEGPSESQQERHARAKRQSCSTVEGLTSMAMLVSAMVSPR